LERVLLECFVLFMLGNAEIANLHKNSTFCVTYLSQAKSFDILILTRLLAHVNSTCGREHKERGSVSENGRYLLAVSEIRSLDGASPASEPLFFFSSVHRTLLQNPTIIVHNSSTTRRFGASIMISRQSTSLDAHCRMSRWQGCRLDGTGRLRTLFDWMKGNMDGNHFD
jgi:hypothetical protein